MLRYCSQATPNIAHLQSISTAQMIILNTTVANMAALVNCDCLGFQLTIHCAMQCSDLSKHSAIIDDDPNLHVFDHRL